MKKNPKKVMDHCPLKKEKGEYVKSECPAIDNVRNIRKELNSKEKTGKVKEEQLDKLRVKLCEAKTDDAKGKFCKACFHKND